MTETRFEISGLRGRRPITWLGHLVAVVSLASLGFLLGPDAVGATAGGVLFTVGAAISVWRGLRARITLHPTRLQVENWGYSGESKAIPCDEIRHLALRGCELLVFLDAQVHTSSSYLVVLHPVAAEELLDRLVEQLERRGCRFTVDQPGSVRSSWAFRLDELFPWQEMTERAGLRISPSGAVEFTGERREPLRGTCFKAFEIHGPGEDPAASAPALRIEDDRVTLGSGVLFGKVVRRPAGRAQVALTNGSFLELGQEVLVDGEEVGRILRGEDGVALELHRAVPEVIAVLALAVHAFVCRDRQSLYDSPGRGQELAAVGPRPRGEPLLRVEAERGETRVYRAFAFWHRILHGLARFFSREARYSGRGSIAFYEDSIHVERDPVAAMDEWKEVCVDLSYRDVTRLEYVAPETLILGFGPVVRGDNRQIAMRLGPMEAQDKFDSMVELIEDRCDGHLYSVLDDGVLNHSREWTWEERFDDLGMTREVTMGIAEHFPARRWWLVTGEEREFSVIADHGLLLVAAADPGRSIILQALDSQLLDGAGMSLTPVLRNGAAVGFRTSRHETLCVRDEAILLDGAKIGRFSLGAFDTWSERADPLAAMNLLASKVTVPKPSEDVTFELERPLPTPWVLALAMVVLLPRHAAQGRPR